MELKTKSSANSEKGQLAAARRIETFLNGNESTLDLSNLNLAYIPGKFYSKDEAVRQRLLELEDLKLWGNQIVDISVLESLENLAELNLSSNQISDISALSEMTNLESLYLHNNQISDISAVTQLTNLTILYLSFNQISDISALSELINSTILDLTNNQISDISALSEMTNLESLYLSSNQISDISVVSQLTNLKLLDLSNNQIRFDQNRLTDETLNYLENQNLRLLIEKNPFISDHPEIKSTDYPNDIDANHKDVFIADYKNWILKTSNSDIVDLPLTHKLVLLGNSNSGKSSLKEFLVSPSDILQKKVSKASTEVLDIKRWNTKNKPYFEIYDFGGQDFYHATYQMFLSSDTSYIIVWSQDNNFNHVNDDKTKERPESYHCHDINYWLGNIKYLSDQSKDEEVNWYKHLCLVETKIDLKFENPKPLDTHVGFGAFENFKVSLFHKANGELDKVRRNFLKAYILHQHDYTSQEVKIFKEANDDFLDLSSEIRKKGNEWTFQDLVDFLKSNSPKWQALDAASIERLLNRFRAAGKIIWYRFDDELKDRVWTNPLDLQKQVLKLIKNKKLKTGVVRASVAEKIPGFTKLKDLLIKQQIIFIDDFFIDDSEADYIIPQNLPLSNENNDPLYDMATLGLGTAFILRFKHFMPLGLMNRLIVMFGKRPEKKHYRRYEMVFTYEGEKVMIHCDMIELKITIRMSGNSEEIAKAIFKHILCAYKRVSMDQVKSRKGMLDRLGVKKKQNITAQNILDQYKILELVPDDLYIALDDAYFVPYMDIEQGPYEKRNSDRQFVIGKNQAGEEKEMRIHMFNAFVDKPRKRPKKVFISYSHDDLAYKKELIKYIETLKTDNLIDVWHDGMLQAGEEWDETIKTQLSEADLVILLISQSFIVSKYIQTVEMKIALSNMEKEGRLFPIVVKNCDLGNWKVKTGETDQNNQAIVKSMADFQCKPQDEKEMRLKPINKWMYPEEAWLQISNSLRSMIVKME